MDAYRPVVAVVATAVAAEVAAMAVHPDFAILMEHVAPQLLHSIVKVLVIQVVVLQQAPVMVAAPAFETFANNPAFSCRSDIDKFGA